MQDFQAQASLHQNSISLQSNIQDFNAEELMETKGEEEMRHIVNELDMADLDKSESRMEPMQIERSTNMYNTVGIQAVEDMTQKFMQTELVAKVSSHI